MCTLIALHRCIAGAPLVVAANRDEFHERPTEGPALREAPIIRSSRFDRGGAAGASRSVLAPRDLVAGGTWLGLNSSGLFAAVTNRRCETPDPTRCSRGLLVMDALAEPTARRAAERLEALPEGAYNPFNLFMADGESAHVVSYDEGPERIDLGPGLHVIGNVHPAESSAKLDRLRAEMRGLAARKGASIGALADVCRTHVAGAPIESTCVHAGAYGTCSSTLLRTGSRPALHYADGAPCETAYRDLTPLLRDLGIVPFREGVQA